LMLHECQGQDVRLIFPPVVERHGVEDFVMDGVHRFLAAIQSGRDGVLCVRVSGSHLLPLPSAPGTWASLRVGSRQHDISEVLPGLSLDLFRPLTPLFNGSSFRFEDRMTAIKFVEGSSAIADKAGGTDERV